MKKILFILTAGMLIQQFSYSIPMQCNFPTDRNSKYAGVSPLYRTQGINLENLLNTSDPNGISSVTAVNDHFLRATHAAHVIPYSTMVSIWNYALWSTDARGGGNTRDLTPFQKDLLLMLKAKISALTLTQLNPVVVAGAGGKQAAIDIIDRMLLPKTSSRYIAIDGGSNGGTVTACTEALKPLMNFLSYAGINLFISPVYIGNMNDSPGGRGWDQGNLGVDNFGKYTLPGKAVQFDKLKDMKQKIAAHNNDNIPDDNFMEKLDEDLRGLVDNYGMGVVDIQQGNNRWVKVSTAPVHGNVPKTCPMELYKNGQGITKCFNGG